MGKPLWLRMLQIWSLFILPALAAYFTMRLLDFNGLLLAFLSLIVAFVVFALELLVINYLEKEDTEINESN